MPARVLVLLVAVLVVAWAVWAPAGREPGRGSWRLHEVERAAKAASRCDEPLGLAGSGDATGLVGVRSARSIWCGRPEGLEALLTWNVFGSRREVRAALQAVAKDHDVTCTTGTELFVLAFTTDEADAAFCRRVGASTPVGHALS